MNKERSDKYCFSFESSRGINAVNEVIYLTVITKAQMSRVYSAKFSCPFMQSWALSVFFYFFNNKK